MNSFGHFFVGALIMTLFLRPRTDRDLLRIALLGGLLGLLPDIDMSLVINGYAEHGCVPGICRVPWGNFQSPTHNMVFTITVTIILGVVAFTKVGPRTALLLSAATFIILWSHWAVFDYHFLDIRDALMSLPGLGGYKDACGRLTSTLVGLLALSGLLVYDWRR